MINLSTTTAGAAHTYACRSGGANMVVVAPLGGRRIQHNPRQQQQQQRRCVPSVHRAANGSSPDAATVVTGGLELLGEGFVGIGGFRNNRFQYQIPTVGQHYGNAFHLGDDDEEVVTEFIGDSHHAVVHVARDGSVTEDTAAMYLQDIVGDHTNEDDEEDDVEMSTAVEVISIDPDCDYDTEDEHEDEEAEGEEDTEEAGGEDSANADDDDEEDCERMVQEDDDASGGGGEAGWYYRNGGTVGWIPVATGERQHVDMVAHNVSLTTVDVADKVEEVILLEEENEEIDGLTSGSVRSRSNSCRSTASTASQVSTSSSNSNISGNSNNSSANKSNAPEDDQHHSEGPSLEFSPTKGVPFEPPLQLLQEPLGDLSPPPAQLLVPPTPGRNLGRRKRTSSSQRRSFSMPHSPVGDGTGIDGLVSTSFSFEDLDSLVLSPLKTLAGASSPVKLSESELDDSLVEEMANGGNFDLTEYITGDDSTNSCDTNAGFFSERKRPKAEHTKPDQPGPPHVPQRHPKSRGKELHMLRQLMLPQKQNRSQSKNSPQLATTGHDVDVESATPPSISSNGRRSCTAKMLTTRVLSLDDDSNSESDDDHLASENGTIERNRLIPCTPGNRKGKRKALMDDADKDPTWNPSGLTGGTKSHQPHQAKGEAKAVSHPKQASPQSMSQCSSTGKPSPNGNRNENGHDKPSSVKAAAAAVVTLAKGIKFGPIVRKDPASTSSTSGSSSSSCSSVVASTTVPLAKKPPLPSNALKADRVTNVLRKKTNVKLDHDYCSPKNGSLHAPGGGLSSGNGSGAAAGGGSQQQRKTIEIPFLLPTKDQLRHERKLQKEKKRNERTDAQKAAAHEQQPQLQQQQQLPGGAADNIKDKQTPHNLPGSSSSSSNNSSCSGSNRNPSAVHQKTPSTTTGTHSPVHQPSSSSVDGRRGAVGSVDKPLVNNSNTAGANEEVTQLAAAPVKLLSSNNHAAGGGAVTVKRQVSLLKINQQHNATTTACCAPASSPRPPIVRGDACSANGAGHVSSPVASVVAGTGASSDSVVVKLEDGGGVLGNTSYELATGSTGRVVVRRKLNLQEYKKRREHPGDVTPAVIVVKKKDSVSSEADPRRRCADHSQAFASDTKGGVLSGYTNSGHKVATTTVQTTGGGATSSSSAQVAHTTAIKQKPLDPISAAKMKALRMQQLKKEAAIKSNEAKLSQKTIPLLPIVPLAQITSVDFDEHGNPLTLDEARRRANGPSNGRDGSLKHHPDYEEIVIVSVGCNTALTIVPTEPEPVLQANGKGTVGSGVKEERDGCARQQSLKMTDRDASLLLDIKDTLKRCHPSVSNMPGSSLIASIQEVVIKKSNNLAQSPSTAAASATGGGVATVQARASSTEALAETAITLKTQPGTASGQDALMMHQSSPYLGVSPPSSFSPGKPERAHTTSPSSSSSLSSSVVLQGHVKMVKLEPDAATLKSSLLDSGAPPTAPNGGDPTVPDATVPEHGEDKVIMHLRKDRPRPRRADASVQTESCAWFVPLRKLSPRKIDPTVTGEATAMVVGMEQKTGGTPIKLGGGGKEGTEKDRSERNYRTRRREGSAESSGAESIEDGRRSGRSNRSKSRSGRDQVLNAHHHHHQQNGSHRAARKAARRHRSSRRRSSRSRSSGSRSRSRSGYSHQHHQHHQGAGGHYSRGRRKSRTSSRSSSSSLPSRRDRRSMSASSVSSTASSMGSSSVSRSSSSRSRRSRSRSRSPPRSRSRSSGLRSATPPDQQRYQSRERLNHRRPLSPERKIVYIGRLECNIRKDDLYEKFQPYGKIIKITLHNKDNGVRYGFVTFEKPQQAYSAIDASTSDPNLRGYDVSFGGRRAFCRMQYADLDGELSDDLDHHIPYVAMDGSLVMPPRVPMAYGSSSSSVGLMCHKKDLPIGGGSGVGSGGGDSFEDLLMQFKKGIGAMKAPRKT